MARINLLPWREERREERRKRFLLVLTGVVVGSVGWGWEGGGSRGRGVRVTCSASAAWSSRKEDQTASR